MRKLRLIPDGVRVRVAHLARAFYVISGTAVVVSLVLFLALGLNYGIDFRGGVLMEVQTEGEADLASIRATLGALDIGDVQVQSFGAPDTVLIRAETRASDTETGRATGEALAVRQIRGALEGTVVEYRRAETVGPKVSAELIITGIAAVLAAVALVLVYIWLRFEWQFSLGAVLALIHDVALTIGVFSLLRFEFNLSIIAAILTIVGYSLNDTVVVYDRIRENLRKYKKMPLAALIDLSVSQTLSRTLMTSLTTLLALGSLYLFGGTVIRGFSFAMIWGVVIGTYSSVFIAAPLLLMTGIKREWATPAPAR